MSAAMRARAAMPPMTPPAMAPVLEVLATAPLVEEGAPAEGAVFVGLPLPMVEEPLELEVSVEEVWPEVWFDFVALVLPVVLDVLSELVALGAPVVLELALEAAV